MPKNPYDNWFWSDWFGDPGVSLLDPVSRCVWFELLGRMHQTDTCELTRTAEEIARECRVTESQAKNAIKDMIRHKVGQITVKGEEIHILSRRRQRDMIKKQNHANRQSRWKARYQAPDHDNSAEQFPEGREVKPWPTKPSQVIAEADKIGYLMSQYEAEKFISDHKSVDWKNKFNQPITDWPELLKTWKHRQSPEQRRQAIEERGGGTGRKSAKEVVL